MWGDHAASQCHTQDSLCAYSPTADHPEKLPWPTFSHFLIQLVQSGLNELPAVWGRLSTPLYFWHFVSV